MVPEECQGYVNIVLNGTNCIFLFREDLVVTQDQLGPKDLEASQALLVHKAVMDLMDHQESRAHLAQQEDLDCQDYLVKKVHLVKRGKKAMQVCQDFQEQLVSEEREEVLEHLDFLGRRDKRESLLL